MRCDTSLRFALKIGPRATYQQTSSFCLPAEPLSFLPTAMHSKTLSRNFPTLIQPLPVAVLVQRRRSRGFRKAPDAQERGQIPGACRVKNQMFRLIELPVCTHQPFSCHLTARVSKWWSIASVLRQLVLKSLWLL